MNKNFPMSRFGYGSATNAFLSFAREEVKLTLHSFYKDVMSCISHKVAQVISSSEGATTLLPRTGITPRTYSTEKMPNQLRQTL